MRPGDVDAALVVVYDLYEIGDAVIRWLADEARLPAMREHLNSSRAKLRTWVGEGFCTLSRRARRTVARSVAGLTLIVALDVYAWKVLRRDFRLDSAEARAVVRSLVMGLIKETERGGILWR